MGVPDCEFEVASSKIAPPEEGLSYGIRDYRIFLTVTTLSTSVT